MKIIKQKYEIKYIFLLSEMVLDEASIYIRLYTTVIFHATAVYKNPFLRSDSTQSHLGFPVFCYTETSSALVEFRVDTINQITFNQPVI